MKAFIDYSLLFFTLVIKVCGLVTIDIALLGIHSILTCYLHQCQRLVFNSVSEEIQPCDTNLALFFT